MKSRYLSLLCGAAFLCCASAVNAQEPPAPPADGPRPELAQKAEDDLAIRLKLTDEQKEQARKIHEEGREQMKEMHKKMQELRRSNMEDFEKILTPEQKAEFDKIKADRKHLRKPHRPGKKGPKMHEKMRHHEKPLPPMEHHDGELPPPPPAED